MNAALRAVAIIITIAPLFLTGCGMPAAPQPPSLKLSEPVKDLSASRVGDDVHLRWTMPKRTTDHLMLEGDQRVHICRKLENGPCNAVADILQPPQKPAEYTDHLPVTLRDGSPKLLTYLIQMENHAKKTAGDSNPAYTAAGAAPAVITGFTAEVQPDGVLLHWMPGPTESSQVVRLTRILVAKQGESKSVESAGTPPPEQQRLEVSLGASDPGKALDKDAAFNHTYRYTAVRVLTLTLDKHAIELLGVASDPATLTARDVFPPHTPSDVAAVADPDARAIDLSWAPNQENDLAGYIVYRRDLATEMQRTRISPAGVPLVAPAFHDAHVEAGHRYAYSVSAVDRDGNESPRSAEVEEGLPQQ